MVSQGADRLSTFSNGSLILFDVVKLDEGNYQCAAANDAGRDSVNVTITIWGQSFVYMPLCVHACVHACMHERVCVCMCACIHMCVCMYVYMRVYVCARTSVLCAACAHVPWTIGVHVHVHVHTHVCMRVYV